MLRSLVGSEMCIRDSTGSFVNTVTIGCVGAPNGRAPFRFHGAVVGFVDRCLSRTRNLAASNKHLAELFSGRSWPKIGPGMIFFGVFEKFETFFSKICAHSERYNILAGIFEILTFYGNIAFPLSPALVPMTTETRCSKLIFSKLLRIQKRNRLKIRSYRRYGEHGKKMFVFLGLFVHAAAVSYTHLTLPTTPYV